MECLQFDWKQNQTKLSFITLYLYLDDIVILLVTVHSNLTVSDYIKRRYNSGLTTVNGEKNEYIVL